MPIEVRKTWVWITALCAVASAALLAASGGTGPRIASLVGDAMRPHDAASARPAPPAGRGEASTAKAAVAGPAR